MNALAIALDSIWRHRLRSALTALGVVIGVFAVVTLVSLGASVNAFVSGQFSSIGATVITVTPANPSAGGRQHQHLFGRGGGAAFGEAPSTLTVADVDAILARHSGAILRAAPVADLPVPVSAGSSGPTGNPVDGVTAPYFAIEQLGFAHGSFSGRGVVLGSQAAQDLFPHVTNPVGQTVRLGSASFPVTGVLKAASGLTARIANPTVFAPVEPGLKAAGLTTVSEIVIQADSNNAVNRAADVVTRVLDSRHPIRNFAVTKDSVLLSTIQKTLSTITTFLAGLAAISLLVGGVGIMNIMLVTVTERFREIGIRKAMGARDSDVLLQFLAESILLAVLGGAVGLILSAVASGIVGRLAGFASGLTVGAVVLALVFSMAVGTVFGVLPALRAARLMPVEALRTE